MGCGEKKEKSKFSPRLLTEELGVYCTFIGIRKTKKESY